MTSYTQFSAYINENASSLAVALVDSVLEKMSLEITNQEKEQAIEMYTDLLQFLGDTFDGTDQEKVPPALIEWSKNNAQVLVASGGNMSEIIVRYTPTREVFSDLVTEVSERFGLSIKENAYIIKRTNTMLDVSLNEMIYAFERLSEQLKEETQKELLKLSAPIVPVRDNIVVMPLIGYFYAERANYILEYVIPEMAEMDVSYVIADYSGVFTINEQMAEALFRIGSSLRLMGINVVVAGLRPDLAQAIVNSGIDMSKIRAFATVKQALENI